MIPPRRKGKPPYKIPDMEFIRNVPWNGLRVVSTFSGGGGSCIGYRWSGAKVVWANEFIKHASDTYRLNHPDTYVDERDIKIVTSEEILSTTGLKVGELDIFDGSPPCQGFSIANQNRLNGKAHTYQNGQSQVNEDMFDEYIRLLKGLMPKVFIAENVKGMTIGKAKQMLGSFEMDLFDSQDETILHKLMNCGYVLRYQIMNAADYGTPQNRQRVFFVGVRKDLNIIPTFPAKLGYQYSVLDALPHLVGTRPLTRNGGWDGWKDLNCNESSPTILAKTGVKNPWEVTIKNRAHGFSKGNEFKMDKPAQTIPNRNEKSSYDGARISVGYGMGYADNKPGNTFPRNKKDSVSNPIETIQKMPGIAGGVPVHVVNGDDKRKFTIDELKALGGFPNDYKMLGSYGQQWSIIGNSVAPPQMKRLASHLYETIFSVINK